MPNIPENLLRQFQRILVDSSPAEYLMLTTAEKEQFEQYKNWLVTQ